MKSIHFNIVRDEDGRRIPIQLREIPYGRMPPEFDEFRGQNGVYVIVDRRTSTPVYVGESHANRLIHTLLVFGRWFSSPTMFGRWFSAPTTSGRWFSVPTLIAGRASQTQVSEVVTTTFRPGDYVVEGDFAVTELLST